MVKIKRGKDGKPCKDSQGRSIWGFDIRVSQGPGLPKRRVRMYEFSSREDAQQVVNKLREIERVEKFGLRLPAKRPKLIDLIRARLETITRKNELTRSTRVLLEWLAMIDPAVPPGSRDASKVTSNFLVEDVDSAKIAIYAKRRAAEGLLAASIRRELIIIAATLHQADVVFSELAQWRAPKVPYPKVSKSRRERIITQEEASTLLNHLYREQMADEPIQQYQARIRVGQVFQFALLTGMRHGEIVKLRWADLDWERNRILVKQGKTDRYKQIPITKPMLEILDARKALNLPGNIFSRGGEIHWRFYIILRKACEECNIPYGKNTPDGILLHIARHTVTTRLVGAGLDFDTVGQITGHGARELIVHYTHHTPASMKLAAEALEKSGTVDKKRTR